MAIIAVLVAIAAPLFLGALDDAKDAVQQANIRSIKGLATAEILSNWSKYGKLSSGDGIPTSWSVTASWDEAGNITITSITPGEETAAKDGDVSTTGGTTTVTGMVLVGIKSPTT